MWCSNRDTLTLLRSTDGRGIVRLTTPEPATFTCLQFSPDGRWLAVGNTRGKVELWDLDRIRSGLDDLGGPVDWTLAEATQCIVPRLHTDPERCPPSWVSLGGPPAYVPGRDPQASPDLIDLTRFFNSPLGRGVPQGAETEPHLERLVPGLIQLDGTRFDVRGLVRLRGEHPGLDLPRFPTELVQAIPSRRLERIHLLAAAHTVPTTVRDSLEIARLHLQFMDGTESTFPIRMGEELDEFRVSARVSRDPRRASVAWTGFDSASEAQDQRLRLYHSIFTNTLPSKPVQALAIRSSHAITSPFIVGLTLE